MPPDSLLFESNGSFFCSLSEDYPLSHTEALSLTIATLLLLAPDLYAKLLNEPETSTPKELR